MVDLLLCVGGPLDGVCRPWDGETTVHHEPRTGRGWRRARRLGGPEYDAYALARWRLPNGREELRWHHVADELARIA